MKKKLKKRKILLTMLANLGIMTCIIQIPSEINAQEATIFEEEDYTLQLENYQKELDIDINEISYNSETDWDCGIGHIMVEIIFQKLQKARMDIIFALASIFIFVALNVKS